MPKISVKNAMNAVSHKLIRVGFSGLYCKLVFRPLERNQKHFSVYCTKEYFKKKYPEEFQTHWDYYRKQIS